MDGTKKLETATLAGGCFWCTEAVFKRLKGVESVVSGYTGGTKENPTYYDVSGGDSGHAEAIQIEFDPTIISFGKLLEVFWKLHDPTTLNRQGNDVGTQYRSAIFYHSREQKQTAGQSKQTAEKSKIYPNDFVTEIAPFTTFYKAEVSHQDYYKYNKFSNPYCTYVIDPKIKKLYKDFKDVVKKVPEDS